MTTAKLPIIGSDLEFEPAALAEIDVITDAAIPDANWRNYVATMNQNVATTSTVTHTYIHADRASGFQLDGAENTYLYYGLYAIGTNGALLETDAGLDIAFRPGGGTHGLIKANGQIVLGGAAPSGSNILTVLGDASISSTLTCLGGLSGTSGKWEAGAGNKDILWSNTYINSTYSPDMDGTGIGSKFRQYYYDATTPAAADIGSQKWVTEGDWTATASTRNSTVTLQNVKNGTLQDVLSIDSNAAATLSGTLAATKYNKVTITTPATGATLTIADGKTATFSNTLTFTGTDSSSVALGAGGTVLYTAGTIKDGISQNYAAVTNGSYNVMYKAPYAGTINSLSHIVRSIGTAGTVKAQINGVDVTGLTGIVPTVSGNTTAASGANTFVAGDSITLVFASTVAVVDFQYVLNITRGLV